MQKKPKISNFCQKGVRMNLAGVKKKLITHCNIMN